MPSNIMKPLLNGRYRKGMFDHVDAILDSPAIDHLPWILDDYPNAKVILTERDPKIWAQRRYKMHPCSSPPFFTWYKNFASPCMKTPPFILEHAYLAWYSYVKKVCEQKKISLLILNLFEESDNNLWMSLANFTGARQVPRGKFGKRLKRLT